MYGVHRREAYVSWHSQPVFVARAVQSIAQVALKIDSVAHPAPRVQPVRKFSRHDGRQMIAQRHILDISFCVTTLPSRHPISQYTVISCRRLAAETRTLSSMR